jgi:hypothetical protein
MFRPLELDALATDPSGLRGADRGSDGREWRQYGSHRIVLGAARVIP